LKEIDFSKAILKGKGSELKAGYDPLKIQIKGLKGFKEIQYQDIKGVSISKKLFPAENIIRIDTQQTKLIKEIIDFTKEKSFVKFTGTKTAFSKTFGYGSDIKITNIKEIIKSTKIAPVSKIDKIINKLDDFGSVKTQSEYYGKGLYERSSGGALPQQIQQPSAQLKAILKQSVAPPDIALKTQIKDLIKVDYASALAFKTGSLTGLAPLSALKQSSELKASLKLDLDINTLGKLKQEIAIKQGTKTKTVQISTTKQINDLISMPVTSSLLSPVFKEPIIQPQMPKIPAFPIWFKTPKRKTKKNKLTKQIQDLLFIPDFTSRSIGLGAETITEKQAQAKLKRF